MKRNSKTAQSKNLHLAFYFGFIVFFIILISLSLKSIEVLRKSRFNDDNKFTVAVISKNHTDFISVSSEGIVSKLEVKDVGGYTLDNLEIPHDSYILLRNNLDLKPEVYFSNLIFSRDKDKTNLTVVDFFRLTLMTRGAKSENISEESVSFKDTSNYQRKISKKFVDSKIADENVSIEIVNSSGISGLGNSVAKTISNLGGNVVLVTTSKKMEKESKIYFKNESYTLKKVSKILNIKPSFSDENSLSDVIIVLGEDRGIK